MASIRDEIQALRILSADHRSYFIPAGALNDLLNTETIKSAYRSCKVQPNREKEVLRKVEHGGRRTFAILITIYKPHRIIDFIERDEFRTAGIDSKLPFSRAELELFLPITEAGDFFDKQWELTAPIFSRRAGHRLLDQRTIFPFLESRDHAEGAFGAVHLIRLHPSHGKLLGIPQDQVRSSLGPWLVHRFMILSLSQIIIARKELKVTSSSEPEDLQRECRVLSFLNYLEHPNIVELLGSYTCNGVHSLLFPVAASNLHDFLRTSDHPDFRSESDYLFALCGLASALDKLHSFVSEDLDIRLIGCHHDLKPANVLVQDGRFLLADFGLSNLKEVREGSQTLFKPRDSEFMAPECEDPDHGFKPGIIGRKSDIWSLGCIIAEVQTYITRGKDAIEGFQVFRRVTVGRFTSSAFHAGRNVNEKVESWLDELEAQTTPTGSSVIELVRSTLQLGPEDRPSAEQITLILRFLALKSKFQATCLLCDSMTGQIDLDLLIEKDRFQLWGYILGLSGSKIQGDQANDALRSDAFFQRQYQNISKIGGQLSIAPQSQNDLHARVVKLRAINDDMLSGLPHAWQLSINAKLEQKIVSTEDISLLEKIKTTFEESSRYRSMATLAAIKHMHHLCNNPPTCFSKDLQLTSITWKPENAHDANTEAHFNIGTISAEEKPEGAYVLVEKIKYDEHWVGHVGEQLYSRVAAVTRLLRISATSDNGIRVLFPLGYFHDPSDRCFCLVSAIPPYAAEPELCNTEVVTLRQYIEETYRSTVLRPSLNDRLRLARHLASNVAKIHKASWLHKNISSFSIIFVLPKERRNAIHLPLPYILGFNHSRPNDPDGFSFKEIYSVDVLDYRHPEYAQNHLRTSYQAAFDNYSLGLVLLEIGLWKPLSRMTRAKKSATPKQLLQYVIDEWVSQLGFFGGNTYKEVVTRCLKGDVRSADLKDNAVSVDILYTLTVVEQLENIYL